MSNNKNLWFVRNKLDEQFYGRDIFGYTLPLTEDTYSFGRQQITANFIDAIKQTENRGVFGLRKTGKTSFLFKLQRIIQSQKIGHVFFYDCKSPSLRKLRWNELLSEICKHIAKRLGIDVRIYDDEISIGKTFRFILRKANQYNQRIILIFDEIEYISFKALQDKHWHSDYIDFWQTMWACQSQYKNLVFIVAGVNPSVVEIDLLNGIQNPLFGIVPSEFLRGFSLQEISVMLNTLGQKMGILFKGDAIEYIYTRYGGHPLLTRLACSWQNKQSQILNDKKPIQIARSTLEKFNDERDSDLTFYCKHVVSELREFYPDEYEMLELLASGQTHDFIELSTLKEYVRHLKSCGLLDYGENNTPAISIPVVSRYIGLEFAKKEKRDARYRIVPSDQRSQWLKRRTDTIIRDFRVLEKLIQNNKKPQLFGANSFPEADELKNTTVVNNKADFLNFVNIVNRCFVESIESYGKSINKDKYFWNEINKNYPGLYHALERIKVYRHEYDHLVLNNTANEKLLRFLESDLENRKPTQINDFYFVLQQRILDGLLTGITIETNTLSEGQSPTF